MDWTPVISVGGSLIVALVVTFLGRRSEHAKWLRDQRSEAYLQYLREVDRAKHNWVLRENNMPFEEVGTEEVGRWVSSIAILGPEPVRVNSSKLRDAFVTRSEKGPKAEPTWINARNAYLLEVRKTLGIPTTKLGD